MNLQDCKVIGGGNQRKLQNKSISRHAQGSIPGIGLCEVQAEMLIMLPSTSPVFAQGLFHLLEFIYCSTVECFNNVKH